MPSLRNLFSIALLATSSIFAQTIDPNSVPLSLREYWCSQQTAQCPLICLQNKGSAAGTLYNSCEADTLAYSCVCANGLSPNVSEYSQTIPYFECTTFADQCVNNCGIGDNICASDCRTATPCGAQNPTRYNLTTTSTSASATATPAGQTPLTNSAGVTTGASPSATQPASLNGNADSTTGAAAALLVDMTRLYGTFLLAVGIVGGFALGL